MSLVPITCFQLKEDSMSPDLGFLPGTSVTRDIVQISSGYIHFFIFTNLSTNLLTIYYMPGIMQGAGPTEIKTPIL